MNNSVTYRFLNKKDAPFFSALRLRSLKEEPQAFFPTFDELKEKSLAFWEDCLTGDSFVGAFSEENLAGFAAMEISQRQKTKHRAYIGQVYVAPEARGRKMAKGMLQQLIDKACALGVEHIRLSTDSANERNIQLYKALGFEPYGVERNYLKLADGSYINEVLMIKFLK